MIELYQEVQKMRSLTKCLILAFAFASTIASSALADEPMTKVFVGSGIIYPMSFEGKGLTPTMLHSASVFVPIAERWSLVLKGGMATPITVFQPAPQLQIGASTRLSDHLALGATGIYRYVPHWSGTPSDAHLAGASFGPTIILPSKVSLVFPQSVVRNMTTGQNCFATAFEVVFQL